MLTYEVIVTRANSRMGNVQARDGLNPAKVK